MTDDSIGNHGFHLSEWLSNIRSLSEYVGSGALGLTKINCAVSHNMYLYMLSDFRAEQQNILAT